MDSSMTILEILSWAGNVLKSTNATRSVPQNARLDAQVLLSHVLGVNSAYLFTHGDETLTTNNIETFQRLIERRSRHEPVAYLTQTKAFFGRDFFVNNHVLIPRPDTEVLIEEAKKAITPTSTVIDIGTGSGAIAITLALETTMPTIAIDISLDAITVAKHNAKTLGAKLAIIQGNLFEPITKINPPPSDHFVVVANLPYLTPWQWEALDPDVKTYEPKLALVGGADGLALYDKLCEQLRSYIHEQSRQGRRIMIDLFIEIDQSQKAAAPALIKSHFPTAQLSVTLDLAKKERIVRAVIR
ncbi:MAG: peptide chain release factor N(5)-glutamine methyltransferase [Patescibacteria group bacterium]